jgi:hypothetical protein
MGFNIADNYIGAGGTEGARRLEHGVGLAYAGRGSEEYLETPAFFGCFLAPER